MGNNSVEFDKQNPEIETEGFANYKARHSHKRSFTFFDASDIHQLKTCHAYFSTLKQASEKNNCVPPERIAFIAQQVKDDELKLKEIEEYQEAQRRGKCTIL